mmetsp:Transcript_66269/g.145341  ORF Transcript_66269/g.145341 Transcript_66269/m.145341 type:complete len:301 (+) Transcript_66269:1298-2200(+)
MQRYPGCNQQRSEDFAGFQQFPRPKVVDQQNRPCVTRWQHGCCHQIQLRWMDAEIRQEASGSLAYFGQGKLRLHSFHEGVSQGVDFMKHHLPGMCSTTDHIDIGVICPLRHSGSPNKDPFLLCHWAWLSILQLRESGEHGKVQHVHSSIREGRQDKVPTGRHVQVAAGHFFHFTRQLRNLWLKNFARTDALGAPRHLLRSCLRLQEVNGAIFSPRNHGISACQASIRTQTCSGVEHRRGEGCPSSEATGPHGKALVAFHRKVWQTFQEPTCRWPLLGPGNAAQTTTIQWTSPLISDTEES